MSSPLKKSSRAINRLQVRGTGNVRGTQSPTRGEVEICDVSPGGLSFLAKKPSFQKGELVQIDLGKHPSLFRLRGIVISITTSPETIPLARFSIKFEQKLLDFHYQELLKLFTFK